MGRNVNEQHIKTHYYLSYPRLNPSGIVPLGPEAWWRQRAEKGGGVRKEEGLGGRGGGGKMGGKEGWNHRREGTVLKKIPQKADPVVMHLNLKKVDQGEQESS